MTTQALQEIWELLTNNVVDTAENLSLDPPVYRIQALGFMDIWKEQLERDEERIERYPSIFWSWSADYDTEGFGRRKANSSRHRLTARLVFENMKYDDTYLNTIEGTGYLNVKGTEWLATKEAVRNALHGYNGRFVRAMQVESESLDTSNKALTVIEFDILADLVTSSNCV